MDGRINKDFTSQWHVDAALGEAERESCGKAETILPVRSAASKIQLHRFLHSGASRDHGEIKRQRQAAVARSGDVNGERWHPPFGVADNDAAQQFSPGTNMCGQ